MLNFLCGLGCGVIITGLLATVCFHLLLAAAFIQPYEDDDWFEPDNREPKAH